MKLSRAPILLPTLVLLSGTLFFTSCTRSAGLFHYDANTLDTRFFESSNAAYIFSGDNVNTFGNTNAFCFGAVGDSHVGAGERHLQMFSNILDNYVTKNCSFLTILGDLTDKGKEPEYQTLLELLATKGITTYFAVIGNHDVFNNGWSLWKRYFGTAFYSFDVANTHFTVIDNASSTMDKGAYAWLKADLAATSQPVKVVMAHVPVYLKPFTSVFEMANTLETIYFMKIMEDYHVNLVLAGHYHYFADNTFHGVRYIVSGGGNVSMNGTAPPHYITVTINADGTLQVDHISF